MYTNFSKQTPVLLVVHRHGPKFGSKETRTDGFFRTFDSLKTRSFYRMYSSPYELLLLLSLSTLLVLFFCLERGLRRCEPPLIRRKLEVEIEKTESVN